MKKLAISAAVGLIVGALAYHKLVGPKVITKTEVVEVVKVVQDVRKETVQKPDGTIITREESTTVTDSNKRSKSEENALRNDFIVSVKRDLLNGDHITGEIGRRVIGDLYAGAYYRTDGTVGVSLTYTF